VSPDEHTHGHDDHGHTWDPPSELEARVRAFESLLVEKGYVRHDAIDAMVSAFEHDIGPMRGARVVARAWIDPEFKQRLLDDASAVLRELDLAGLHAEHVIAVENTDEQHNMVVCTLCSCYPWALLGLPPSWYKMPAYRSRAVIEPRAVLKEFGVELGQEVQVKVWDSSAQIRYLVVPQRPEHTEGWSEDELASLVTRDSMIGVGIPLPPHSVAG
jgi:nitrile hydratase subunit alpha